MAENLLSRDELDKWLRDFFRVDTFEDYCHNGLQVEGAAEIRKVILGVSLNGLLLRAAIEAGADAVVVHHGFFGKEFFRLTGIRRKWAAILIQHNISLFGVHLPMDAHPVAGHNARLLKWMGAGSPEPLGPGFIAENTAGLGLDGLLERLERHLPNPGTPPPPTRHPGAETFNMEWRRGFQVLANGPEIPRVLAVISGGSSGMYETAVSRGVEAFFCGEIKEPVPAISRETATHFINLGHYRSEIPGILALRDELTSRFGLDARFADIPNPSNHFRKGGLPWAKTNLPGWGCFSLPA